MLSFSFPYPWLTSRGIVVPKGNSKLYICLGYTMDLPRHCWCRGGMATHHAENRDKKNDRKTGKGPY